MFQRIAIFLAVFCTSLTTFASAQPVQFFQNEITANDPVHAEIIVEQKTIQPGQQFWVGIRLKLDEKWHAYWKNPGDTGLPTKIAWQENPSLEFSELMWPAPVRADYQGFINYGYYGETLLLTAVTVSEDLQPEVATHTVQSSGSRPGAWPSPLNRQLELTVYWRYTLPPRL